MAVGLHEAVALCWEDGGHDVYSALRALVRVMLHMEQQSKSLSHMPTCVSSCVGGMIWGDERRSRARYRAKPAWCANPLSLCKCIRFRSVKRDCDVAWATGVMCSATED